MHSLFGAPCQQPKFVVNFLAAANANLRVQIWQCYLASKFPGLRKWPECGEFELGY